MQDQQILENSQTEESPSEEFDVSMMQKTKPQKGMSSTMSVNRNIDKEKGLSYKQIEKRRLKDQKPVIEGFLSWLKQVNPGSNGKLKKAITYINNYLSENVICPVTVGRKNWLFSDTAEGAKANALYLTIVEMAKTYNLNLYDLSEVLV